ncbi:hypothetical protein [Anaerovirgula multivorans]|nr:hypothetical protein [Anaerovirgula multivorans]
MSGCAPAETGDASFAGRYVGYSWRGEANGTTFEDTDQYIETILELDENGIIKDAKMRFFVKKDGFWTTRQSGNAYVDVDFSVDPTPAVPGEDYKVGDSMFTVYTADMMSFYAVVVDSVGTTAVAIVDPITRYQFEMKFAKDFDFDTPVADMTIGNDIIVPTIRTSSGGLLKPSEWDPLDDKTIFDISPWSHVVNSFGTLEGVTKESSIQTFLEVLGVEFDGGQPQPMSVEYGYFGLGGWEGNYRAIEASLKGQDATEKTSLIDWSIPRYAGGINEQNQFGIDVESGATRTVQDSIDGISGATVRMSRESTSYQRALVNAGILDESDVIIGRF